MLGTIVFANLGVTFLPHASAGSGTVDRVAATPTTCAAVSIVFERSGPAHLARASRESRGAYGGSPAVITKDSLARLARLDAGGRFDDR